MADMQGVYIVAPPNDPTPRDLPPRSSSALECVPLSVSFCFLITIFNAAIGSSFCCISRRPGFRAFAGSPRVFFFWGGGGGDSGLQ